MSHARIEQALRRADGRPAIVAYLTAGYPDRERFMSELDALDHVADAVEIGVPFTDPMADGATIQRAGRIALAEGATLDRTLADLEPVVPRLPRVLMSYLNPFLALPHGSLPQRLLRAGIDGVVVPDLPHEEALALREALDASGIALVPMVTPLTSDARLEAIVRSARGFVYAVTSVGTTGRSVATGDALSQYLARVRRAASVPVIAGFGVRIREHVAALCPPADGVVVGSAMVDAIDRGESPARLVESLR